jgi:hypothetical protein
MKPSKKAIVTRIGTGDSRPMNKRTFIRLRWTACIRIGRNGLSGHGEAPYHPG